MPTGPRTATPCAPAINKRPEKPLARSVTNRSEREECLRRVPPRVGRWVRDLSVRNSAVRCRHHGRQDATKRQDAEEFLAAGVAPIRRKSEQAFREEQNALFNAIASDALEIEIPALRAVSVPREREGHASCVEPEIAGPAAPRTQSGQAGEKIEDAGAARTNTIRAAALRADHSSSRLLPRWPIGVFKMFARQDCTARRPSSPWRRIFRVRTIQPQASQRNPHVR